MGTLTKSDKLSIAHGKPLVVLVGETGSGKSALAIEIAEEFNGEIVCADALTVRREVDIGTAKPDPQDQAKVPHHLLDVVEPCEDFTAAVFKRMAVDIIDDIAGRYKLPILVGGTGLYVDGVIFDFNFLPPGNRTARQKLNSLSIEELRGLINEKNLDETGLDVRNKRRLIRLLETEGVRPTRQEMRPNTLLLGLRVPREVLTVRIQRRTDMMLSKGLELEVKTLASKYGWECEALKGIGYREWQMYFSGKHSIHETRQMIIASTLQLAKRQRTWFKRNKSIQWVTGPEEAVGLVTTFLAKT